MRWNVFGAFWAPVAGGVFGALGGVVLGQIMAVASAMETIWLFPRCHAVDIAEHGAIVCFHGYHACGDRGAVVELCSFCPYRAENGKKSAFKGAFFIPSVGLVLRHFQPRARSS